MEGGNHLKGKSKQGVSDIIGELDEFIVDSQDQTSEKKVFPVIFWAFYLDQLSTKYGVLSDRN